MELIDTHYHLTFDELPAYIDGVIAPSINAGVSVITSPNQFLHPNPQNFILSRF